MSIFAPGYQERPYWWDAAPPTSGEQRAPGTAEVAIIGGGIAGLSMAIELGLNGVAAVVLDREAIGWGASSRNGGALSGAGSLGRAKSDPGRGVDAGLLAEMVSEAEASFEAFEALVERERLECHYRRCGRFTGAHSPRAMDVLRRRADLLNAESPDAARVVARDGVAAELATERYFGGLVVERAGSVHPALYVQGLARAAVAHGARLCSGVAVQGYARQPDGRFRLETSAGPIVARELMVATNGYTGPATPWQRRRLIPAASYMIATAPIGEDRVRRLMPHLRAYGDTKKVLYYFRPSPDFTRVLFGGRASFADTDMRRAAATLHRFMVDLLPDLRGVQITHGWKGNVAFAFDMMPHVGVQDGVHYALACNGSGVVTMTHLGRMAARQVLGGANRGSAFSRAPFPTKPFYTGNPWFLPIVGMAYQLRDRMDGWRVGR